MKQFQEPALFTRASAILAITDLVSDGTLMVATTDANLRSVQRDHT